jgi:two-component system chemotaxis sensor kinase CheA
MMFFEEAREQLQALEAGLMDLEARKEDRAHLDRTFRAAHTLKGAAGMVGLATIAQFTHGVEAVLDRIRSGTLVPTPEIISLLLAAKDHLASTIDAEEAEGPVPDGATLAEKLAAVVEGRDIAAAVPSAMPVPAPSSPTEGAAFAIEPKEPKTYRIALTPHQDAFRKGINPLGMLDELRELGTAQVSANCERVPALSTLDPRDCHLAWAIELKTRVSPARLDEVFLFLDEPGQVAIALQEESSEVPGASIPVQEPAPAPQAAPVPAASQKAVPAGRIRVEAEQLDELVSMAGELAILTDSLQRLGTLEAAEPWAGSIEALERLGRRLREATLELRMVDVEELFVRFPRVVRDMAEQTGKQVSLRIEGEDTRLDRTIIERLAEPMIHLLRNAVDHGLETPEERIAAGKPAEGRITIGAGHEGDRVAIRVTDDGRGLDRARIARKGVALGMLPPETPASDPRVGNLIFEPGFSTRERVGELSGRGVGLDVVRDAIRGLQGSVTLRSVEGKGTSFLIRLPLTLAMIDGLLIEVAGGQFVVPIGQVDECVALAADDAATTMGRPAAIVRGELLPIVPLREMFGESPLEAACERRELLLTRHAEQRVAVEVDRLLGRVQAVIQPLGDSLARMRRFSGATILGDGSICLILDLPTLVSIARVSEHNAPTTLSPDVAHVDS